MRWNCGGGRLNGSGLSGAKSIPPHCPQWRRRAASRAAVHTMRARGGWCRRVLAAHVARSGRGEWIDSGRGAPVTVAERRATGQWDDSDGRGAVTVAAAAAALSERRNSAGRLQWRPRAAGEPSQKALPQRPSTHPSASSSAAGFGGLITRVMRGITNTRDDQLRRGLCVLPAIVQPFREKRCPIGCEVRLQLEGDRRG